MKKTPLILVVLALVAGAYLLLGGRNEPCELGTTYSECISGYNTTQTCEVGGFVVKSTVKSQTCPVEAVSSYRNASVLGSWDGYKAAYASSPDVKALLACSNEFDCNSQEVKAIVQDIKAKYTPKTPLEYIDAATKYVNAYLIYTWYPQDQCGIKASEYVYKRDTNCVGYATLMTAVLRAEGIPAKQVAGCVSHSSGWKCVPFSFLGGVAARAGNIRYDQPLGHTYVKVYAPDRPDGWLIVDPTVGTTISGLCVGYGNDLGYGGVPENNNRQVCYIPESVYKEECYEL